MEPATGNSMVISIDQKTISPHEQSNDKLTRSSAKKGKRARNIFKVALFMMRGRSKSKLVVSEESKSVWRRILGSMRPLHLQNDQSPPHDNNTNMPQSKPTITSSRFANGVVDSGDDAFDSASEFTNSPSPCSSCYASAVGLDELVQEENEKEGVEEMNSDDGNSDGEGDEMIDAKAEEFIAHFYHQMRLERFDDVDRHYQEISMRSLGL
ncbi:unnamed protein product [Sphenostylis stenocarpa]|uniref:Uncharacterized protein n=1 Tax=Sphenostylis stenocarpa TaxID=92480 RepID=A0AA86SQD9_9FABA|nr:unnamed protein product [Sphenostylis stenocarpa]